MQPVKIYEDSRDVNRRLQSFGTSCEELTSIVRQVVAARAEAVDDDPVATAGLFAYIHGTRHLRALFRSKKWLRHRQDGIESVRHPEKSLYLVYQSVDLACSWTRSPRAISGKGSGADRVIDMAQRRLFSDEELDQLNPMPSEGFNTGCWFFCVSVNGEDIRAELSLPAALGGNNFKQFIERIFIVRGGEWESLKIETNADDDAVEFEPNISRK